MGKLYHKLDALPRNITHSSRRRTAVFLPVERLKANTRNARIAMSENGSKSNGVESLAEIAQTLADTADALAEHAQEGAQEAEAETDERSAETADSGEYECKHCGHTAESPQALGGHMRGCGPDKAGRETAKSAELPTQATDIPGFVRGLSYAQAHAIAQERGRKPAKGDAGPHDTAAKALVRSLGGQKSQYVEAFGGCEKDGCSKGANGLRASHCHAHTPDNAGEDTDAPAPDKSDAKSQDGGMTRAQYEAALVAEGVAPGRAAELASERFA